MTTLEDKILGEKKQYYCSSSEDEGEESDNHSEEGEKSVEIETQRPVPNAWQGTSTNTGPKGVIKDWQRFKQLESEKREEQEREKLELIKKLSLTCAPQQEENQEEIDQLLNDDFLLEYQKQRMMEMLSTNSLPRFGRVVELRNGNEFLDAIDNEHKSVTIIIHIYENNVPACKAMNTCFKTLCQDYPLVKFCKLVGSSAGMSHRFKAEGVPALLVYKAGQVVGNFVRVSDQLGTDFYAGDVENLLIEHGMLNDRACVPYLVQSESQHDSDLSLE